MFFKTAIKPLSVSSQSRKMSDVVELTLDKSAIASCNLFLSRGSADCDRRAGEDILILKLI